MAGVAPIVWQPKLDALAEWVVEQLGVGVGLQWARQDAPPPAYPFALLDIIAGPVPVHHDRRVPVDEGNGSIRVYVVGDRTLTLSVEVLVSFEGRTWDPDADAVARAALLQSSLALPEVLEALGDVGLGVLDVGAVQDRRTPLDAGWVSRAGFDVSLHLVSQIDPGSVGLQSAVETVEITATVDPSGGWQRGDFGLPSLVMRFYGEQRVTTPAATTVVTPGTYVKAGGTFTAGALKDFDAPVNGRLRYIGTEARQHNVRLAFAVTSSVAANVKVGISKNGAAPTVFTEVKAASDRVGGAVDDVLELAPNEYIEAWLTADGAVNVTAQSLSLIATA